MAKARLLVLTLFFGIITCDALLRVPLKKSPKPMPPLPNLLKKRIDQLAVKGLENNHIEPISTLKYFDIYGQVRFGTPPQPLNLYFHTVSTELWVFSNKYSQNCIICPSRNKYDHISSSSYVRNGTPAFGGYFTGNMSGYLSMDTVEVGGVQIRNQTFTEATNIQELPYNMNVDGGFGLGLPSNETLSSPLHVLLNMAKQKLSSAVFSFIIKRNMKYSDSFNITDERLILGGVATDLIDKDTLNYVPALGNNLGFWEIKMDKVQFGGVDIGCVRGCSAVAIPNFPGFLGPDDEINGILTELTKFELNPYNCDPDKLPALSFIINNKNYTFLGKDYIMMMDTPMKKSSLCMPELYGNNATTFNVPQSSWILGNTFMAKVYTVFDLEQRNVGFAQYKSGAGVLISAWPFIICLGLSLLKLVNCYI